MNKELIYIWIKKSENEFISNMGLNLSPNYLVTHNEITKRLEIKKNDDYQNVYSRNNVSNLTAIIGENGTGKTTIIEYITKLSVTPILGSGSDVDTKEYIAIYSDGDHTKAVNRTNSAIYVNDKRIEKVSNVDFNNDNLVSKISHIYISNSEYSKDLNLQQNGVYSYVTLANSSLQGILEQFYRRIFIAPNGIIFDNNLFNVLQLNFVKNMKINQFQSLLDIRYFRNIIGKESFLAGRVDTMEVEFGRFASIVFSRYIEKQNKEKIENLIETEISKLNSQNGIKRDIIVNLISELTFCYKFKLKSGNLSIDEAYGQCRDFIVGSSIFVENEKKYYLNAVAEIDKFLQLFEKAKKHISNDIIISVEINTIELSDFIGECIKEQSFILKYMYINDLLFSSGERALLNITSRLLFASQIRSYFYSNKFKFNDNILLLIDELDLYLHPEWQRKIIKSLLDELKNNFSDNQFQIIITSHSPIILSDIPKSNVIYLKKTNGIVKQKISDSETFAANIHSLFKDSFFLEGGIGIGDFASEYINNLIFEIKSGKISKEVAQKKIEIIGEPAISKKLLELAKLENHQVIVDRIVNRNSILDFLKKQRREIDYQIKLLENECNDKNT